MQPGSFRPGAVSRRTALLGALGVLAGCAAAPVVLDRASMAGVKRIAVPTIGFPVSPVVDVTNGIGKQFGMIGLVTTAVVFRNRVDALKAIMAAQGFEPRTYFTEALDAQVGAMGYQVAPAPADPLRRGFLDSYAGEADCDAVLDVCVTGYGLIANSDRDSTPYRPAVAARVQLVSTRDRSVLMRDAILFRGIDVPLVRPGLPPAPVFFTSFSEATADPALAVAALRGALDYAAHSVTERMA